MMVSAAVIGMNLGYLDIGPGFQSLFEDVFLVGVIMAAATGQQQHANRFSISSRANQRDRADQETGEEGEAFHV